jgi:hypothetical protein
MSLPNASDLLALERAFGPGGFSAARRLIDSVDNVNSAVGAVNGTGVTLGGEYTSGITKQTVITFSSVVITMTDGTTNGSIGALKFYDFPVGALKINARTNLTLVAAAGIGATATVKHAIGTAAEATNDTLDSVQANIIASTDTVLVSSAGAAKGLSTATLFIDGTAGAIDLYLNFGVADAGSTANSTLTVSGTITITWQTLATA